MRQISLVDLKPLFRCLPAARQRRLLVHTLKVPAEAESISAGNFLGLMFAVTLERRSKLSEDSQAAVLDEYAEAICQHGDAVAEAVDKGKEEYPVLLFTLSDGRFAGLSNKPSWYDLAKGEILTEPPRAVIERQSFDLTSLFVRALPQPAKTNEPEHQKPVD